MAACVASRKLRIFRLPHLGTASRTTALITATVHTVVANSPCATKLTTQSTYSPILLRLEHFHVIGPSGTTCVTLGCRLFVLRPHNSFPNSSPRMNVSLQNKRHHPLKTRTGTLGQPASNSMTQGGLASASHSRNRPGRDI